jgi:hypothetical protein
MGLELTIAFAAITFIIVLAVLMFYFSTQDQLLPPYQEPIAKCPFGFGNQQPVKEDISWPFPSGDKP